ncbi:HAD family hydrolase [Vibrio nereis]|uniref:HAD family hydrolase n=1 Tax=Vibrio nereis TaxID=693 RepID=A0A0M0HSQ5_VIBNE|nr:HAD family hydrolase [Vibrio nereis]KOO04653.1 HAD family hydrolase [Vibrio nereis]
MERVFLFDWGDTLMVDDPANTEKMYLWKDVAAVEGAEETLKALSKHHTIYIATSAQESSEAEIQQAFQRVGLDRYINGYFCKTNVGIEKNCAEFYLAIADELNVKPDELTMVGDVLNKDVYPAIKAGLNAIWFNRNSEDVPENIVSISKLEELI